MIAALRSAASAAQDSLPHAGRNKLEGIIARILLFPASTLVEVYPEPQTYHSKPKALNRVLGYAILYYRNRGTIREYYYYVFRLS